MRWPRSGCRSRGGCRARSRGRGSPGRPRGSHPRRLAPSVPRIGIGPDRRRIAAVGHGAVLDEHGMQCARRRMRHSRQTACARTSSGGIHGAIDQPPQVDAVGVIGRGEPRGLEEFAHLGGSERADRLGPQQGAAPTCGAVQSGGIGDGVVDGGSSVNWSRARDVLSMCHTNDANDGVRTSRRRAYPCVWWSYHHSCSPCLTGLSARRRAPSRHRIAPAPLGAPREQP